MKVEVQRVGPIQNDVSGHWTAQRILDPDSFMDSRKDHHWRTTRARYMFFLDVVDALEAKSMPPLEFAQYGSSAYYATRARDFDTLLVLPDNVAARQIPTLLAALEPFLWYPREDMKILPGILSELGSTYHTHHFTLKRRDTRISVHAMTASSLRELTSAGCQTARRKFKPENRTITNIKPFLVSDVTGIKYAVDPLVDYENRIISSPGSLQINGRPTIPYIFDFLLLTPAPVPRTLKPEVILPLKDLCWRTLVRSVLYYNHWYEPDGSISKAAYSFDPVRLFIRGTNFRPELADHLRIVYKNELHAISLLHNDTNH